jgi:hypothetical protein
MLLREWSSWQARPHDKFEESAQDFGQGGESLDCGIDLRQTRLRLAPRAADEGGAYKLSNGRIAQFLCNSFVSPTPAHVRIKNSHVNGMFPDVRSWVTRSRREFPRRLIVVRQAIDFSAAKTTPMEVQKLSLTNL